MDQNDIDHLLNEKAVGDTKFKHAIKQIGAWFFIGVSALILAGILVLGIATLSRLINNGSICMSWIGS